MQPDAASHSSIDEDVIQHFERARRAGNCDPIEQCVQVESNPRFLATLKELVHIDLEFAWKAQAGSSSAARIEDYLRRFPRLNEPAVLLRLLRDEFRLRQRFGDKPSTEEYQQRFPEIFVSGDEIVETVVAPPLDLCSGTGPNQHLRCAPPIIPGYEILEELGRGGMGVVYRARHVELDRVVALKMMLAGGRADEHDRARFRSEGRSAARLQHPHIVQVFEVGEAAGCPFLTMEFVAGTPLSGAIADAPLPAIAAARLVQQLAQAMKYAHEQGVIHRDLKPSNVLLAGDAGPLTPKIADFGLAKRLEDDSGLTGTSDVLGTPSYMAPEQAAGRIENVGPSSDLYSLGAILYHALTGRPPFRAATALDTLLLVRTQEPVPVRQLQPNVPRDLETICLKCLQKEPAKRYASCAALAGDLGRFLAGEPILARPVSLAERVGRWCRRERKLAGGLAACLLILVLGAAIAGGQWLHGRRREAARFDAGVAELQAGLDFAGREEFALVPQMDQARQQFLEQLADKARALTDGSQDRPALRHKQAEVHFHLGTINELLGRYAPAEAAYREALQLAPDGARTEFQLANMLVAVGRFAEAEERFRHVLEMQSAAGPDAAADLAETLHRLGRLQVQTGRVEEGEQSYRRALELPARELDRAQTEASLAELLAQLGQFSEAELLYASAVARQERLVAAAPGVPVYRLGLARTLSGQATLFEWQSHLPESGAAWRRAHDTLVKLADEHAHRPDYRQEAAAARHNLARFANDGGGWVGPAQDGATLEQQYRVSVTELERLTAEFPAVVEYRRRLATSLNTLATWVFDTAVWQPGWKAKFGLWLQAEALHRRSEALWTQLAADHPDVVAYSFSLAVSHMRYSIVLQRRGQHADAETRYRAGIRIVAALAARYPTMFRYHLLLANLQGNLGTVREQRDDLAGAEEQFRIAVRTVRLALALNPRYKLIHYSLALATDNLADILLQRENYAEAAGLATTYTFIGGPPWSDYQRAFGLLKKCAAAADRDPALSAAQRAERVQSYWNSTIELVRALIAGAGEWAPQVPKYLATEPTLDHVRGRDDFQRLLAESAGKR